MKLSTRHFVAACLVLVLISFTVLAVIRWRRDEPIQDVIGENTITQTVQPSETRQIPDDYVKHGGIYRPKSDVTPPKAPADYDSPFKFVIGKSPAVFAGENKSTMALLGNRGIEGEGGRYTSLLPAKEFDRESFEADPEDYLTNVEPGRIWDTLAPGEGEPITRVGRYMFDVIQGESVNLFARTEPGMPVTFYSSKMGQFDNKLSTISVVANDEGVAEAKYQTTLGQMGDIDVFAGSPVRSGRAPFLVRVKLPDENAGSSPVKK